jgi:gas vesicle protein
MCKLFNFSLGFVLGALAGVAVVALLAPEPGDEMRRRVRARVDQVIEEGRRAAAERRVELETELEELTKGQTPASE